MRKTQSLSLGLVLVLLTAGVVIGLSLNRQQQDTRIGASGTGQKATITLTPATTFTQGSTQTIDIFLNTEYEQIVGLQLKANINGTIPNNLAFNAPQITGLSAAVATLNPERTQATLGLLAGQDSADPTKLKAYSTANNVVKIASLTFTTPQTGALSIAFDADFSASIDSTNLENIIALPLQTDYKFGATAPTPTSLTSSQPPATIDPTPTATTQTQATIAPTPTETTQPTLPPTTPPTQPPIIDTINLSSLSIYTRFNGINQFTGSIPAQINIGFMGDATPLYNQQHTFVYDTITQTFFATFTPNFPPITTEKIWISIKGEKHLKRVFADLNPTSSLTLDATVKPQLPGDVAPQDGVVNAADINLIFAAIGTPVQSTQEVNLADLNYDGAVNSIDSSLFISTLEVGYDENIN